MNKNKRKNMAIRLIRKQARGFRVGEWLFLFECKDALGARTYRGSYVITEVKRQTESTVTFLCRGVPGCSSTDSAFVEVLRDQELHRIAGEPLATIVREAYEP